MPKRLRPIGHDDRLSVVDHLDELRSRLIVCFAVLLFAFGLSFWQNHHLLDWLNRPLPHPSQKGGSSKLNGIPTDNLNTGRSLERLGDDLRRLSVLPGSGLSSQAQALAARAGKDATAAGKAQPQKKVSQQPLTLGVGEPFTVSITVAFYAAILLSLPVILYELYAFIVPALRPTERQVARPIMIVAPALFVLGAIFTYFVVLPPAVRFLQGYNSDQFQSFVQARPLYAFEVMTMAAIGLAFEMPVILLGLRAAGIINGRTLTKHWRYATVILAVIAAAMPGADPVTTGLEVAPLAILFLASIVLLKLADRRDARREAAEMQRYPIGTVGSDGD